MRVAECPQYHVTVHMVQVNFVTLSLVRLTLLVELPSIKKKLCSKTCALGFNSVLPWLLTCCCIMESQKLTVQLELDEESHALSPWLPTRQTKHLCNQNEMHLLWIDSYSRTPTIHILVVQECMVTLCYCEGIKNVIINHSLKYFSLSTHIVPLLYDIDNHPLTLQLCYMTLTIIHSHCSSVI